MSRFYNRFGGKTEAGVSSWNDLTDKPKIPESIINYAYPHIQKERTNGTKYIRNVQTNATGDFNWENRGSV